MAETQTNTGNSQKSRVMVGELPEDFLRVGSPLTHNNAQQIMVDQQAAAALQAAQGTFQFVTPNMARLSVTVVQAKLNKNYGIMKMDTYCRLRIGHSVFETHTANGGGKNPRWNKLIHCHVPKGVDSIYLEIFDEKAFTMDDRVAWAHVSIPDAVFKNDSCEDWYHLNGRLGDSKEGMINIVMTATTAPTPVVVQQQQPLVYSSGVAPPVMVVPGGMPVYQPPAHGLVPPQGQPPVPQQQQGPLFTDADVTQVKDMFPNIDDEVIKSVLEANRGDKDATINSLLSMN